MRHIYRVRYTLSHEVGSFSDNQAGEEQGLTDAFVFLSILYPEDGSYSILPITVDGRHGEKALDPIQEYKAWLLWGHAISEKLPDNDVRKEVAAMPMELLRKVERGKVKRVESES